MKVFSITAKDLKIIFNERGSLITLFVSPLMFIIVLSLALGQSFNSLNDTTPVRVLVVNDDPQGPLATRLLANMSKAGKPNGMEFETNDPDGRLLEAARAESLIKDRKRSMALFIPKGFSEDVLAGRKVTVRFMSDPAAAQQIVKPTQAVLLSLVDQVVEPVLLQVSVSRMLEKGGVIGPTATEINRQIAVAVSSDDTRPENRLGGATFEAVNPAGVTAPKYPSVYQQNVPGFTIMYIFFIVTELAGSVLRERTDGTFRRLLAAPVGRPALLMGKLLPYYLVSLLQVGVLFGIGAVVFGMGLGEHPLGLLLITMSVAACATSLGLLVAAFARTTQQISGIGTIIVLVLASIGGCLVPPVFMPDFMNNLALFTPHGWALFGYQDVMVRGADWIGILPNVGVLLGFAAVFFLVAARRFRFN